MITNYKLHIYLNLLLFIKKKKGIERVKIHILLSIESYFFTSYRRCYIFRADIGSNIALYDTTSPTPCRTCCICIKRNLSNVRNETNRFVVIFLEQRGDDFFFFFPIVSPIVLFFSRSTGTRDTRYCLPTWPETLP